MIKIKYRKKTQKAYIIKKCKKIIKIFNNKALKIKIIFKMLDKKVLSYKNKIKILDNKVLNFKILINKNILIKIF